MNFFNGKSGISLICLFLSLPFPIFAKDPDVIQKLDLNRYIGKWYEIARLPNFFQKQCIQNTQTRYRMLETGAIEVCNTCLNLDRREEKAVGVAKIQDPAVSAKLSVSFFDVLGFRPVWGDYWVLGIGPNYEYSVVGDRNRHYAWILSRTPQLATEDLKDALSVLTKNGYSVEKLIYTPQKY